MTETSAPKAPWNDIQPTAILQFCANPNKIADGDMTIRYVNEAGYKMFEAIQDAIRQDLPHFTARDVVGKSIDIFHKNPAHQRRIMDGLKKPHDGKFTIGGKSLAFKATPSNDAKGKLQFVLVEWQDVTAELAQIAQVDRLTSELTAMAKAHADGSVTHFMPLDGFNPVFASLVQGVNETVLRHIETKKKILACVAELAGGNLDAPIEQFSGERAFINEGIEQIRGVMKRVKGEIDKLTARTTAMVLAHEDGIISHVIDSSDMTPEFARVAEGTNQMVLGHIATKKKILACMTEFADGNFDAEIEKFSGERFFINDTVEAIRSAFKKVTAEITRFCTALENRDLSIEVNRDGFTGDYRRLVSLMDNALSTLNQTIAGATHQVRQVATTVDEMTQASQALATNSQIASSSVDEVSASAEETNAQVRSNATAAESAAKIVSGSAKAAEEGTQKIIEMVKAMDGIRASSQDIAKIIKVIDEIAFQTNLLALNAAVEAARAGQHGRGFAVVAQEVRNLAGRSAKAARETSDLIEDAANRVRSGVNIANETSEAFTRIAEDIEKVQVLVKDIAVASEEQSRGVTQINEAIGEVAKAALATSQQADELASSTAQMQSATETMQADFARFRLRPVRSTTAAPISLDTLSPEMLAQLRRMIESEDLPALPAAAKLPARSTNGAGPDRDQRGFGGF